ncbi:MAG: hypothetical protein GEU28_09655 [Dehalococcoidia bacterium]|nr:hypothetical protein [Dehalococcoidia bacterium]
MKGAVLAVCFGLSMFLPLACDEGGGSSAGSDELCTVRNENFGVSITYSGDGAARVCVDRVESDTGGAEGWALIRTFDAIGASVCSGSIDSPAGDLDVVVRDSSSGGDFASGFCATVDRDDPISDETP